ncbi:unnamed protein product, partial [Protopolystoma xenopodis]
MLPSQHQTQSSRQLSSSLLALHVASNSLSDVDSPGFPPIRPPGALGIPRPNLTSGAGNVSSVVSGPGVAASQTAIDLLKDADFAGRLATRLAPPVSSLSRRGEQGWPAALASSTGSLPTGQTSATCQSSEQSDGKFEHEAATHLRTLLRLVTNLITVK